MIYWQFYQPSIFISLHYFSALVLLDSGILYLRGIINQSQKIMILGFILEIIACSCLLLCNICTFYYFSSLIYEHSNIITMIVGSTEPHFAIPLDLYPFISKHHPLTTGIFYAYICIILTFINLILGILVIIFTFSKRNFQKIKKSYISPK